MFSYHSWQESKWRCVSKCWTIPLNQKLKLSPGNTLAFLGWCCEILNYRTVKNKNKTEFWLAVDDHGLPEACSAFPNWWASCWNVDQICSVNWHQKSWQMMGCLCICRWSVFKSQVQEIHWCIHGVTEWFTFLLAACCLSHCDIPSPVSHFRPSVALDIHVIWWYDPEWLQWRKRQQTSFPRSTLQATDLRVRLKLIKT